MIIFLPGYLFPFLVVSVVFVIQGCRRRITSHFFWGLLFSGLSLFAIGAVWIYQSIPRTSEHLNLSDLGLALLGFILGIGVCVFAIGFIGLARPSIFCPNWSKQVS